MRNGLSPGYSASITLADRDLNPNLLTDIMYLEPGTETDIKLSVSHVTRMPEPYSSHCRDHYPMDNEEQIPYNAQRCRGYCYIKSVKRTCNCTTTAVFEGTANRTMYDESKFCLSKDPCFRGKWLTETFEKGVEGLHEMCDMCTPECQTWSYIVSQKRLHSKNTWAWTGLILFQTTISKAKWPSDDFLPYLAQKAGIKPKEVLADEGQGKQQSKVPGAFCVTN